MNIFFNGFVISNSGIFLSVGLVAAINALHASLGSPSLPGWGVSADPCDGQWQGVVCEETNIITM